MLHVPCSRCARPLRVDQVHTWLYGDGFCGPTCATSSAATEAYRTPPVAREIVQRVLVRIDEAMRLARLTAVLGQQAVRMRGEAHSVQSGGVALLGHLAGGVLFQVVESAAETHAELAESKVYEASWQLEQAAVGVLRSFMALAALGHTVVIEPIQPMVTRYGDVLAATPTPRTEDLQELHRYFEHLKGGTLVFAAGLPA